MTTFTDYAENALIDWFFRGAAAPVLPASWYLALFTTNPGDAAGGIEVTGGSYARVAIPRSLAAFAGTQGVATILASTGSSAATSNNTALTFALPTADWGTISHVGLFDAAAGGNLWNYGALAAPVPVALGTTAPRFDVAAFTFTWDD